jgi:prepilin-type N-terminal cleavage/methylation domain-containing protein
MIRNGARARSQGGFTLVELMIVVAIIGMLASVAFPQYSRSIYRARAAERMTVMQAIGGAVNDMVAVNQSIPSSTSGSGTSRVFQGADNPPGTPGNSRRVFDWTMSGWKDIPLVVQGSAFYTYNFQAIDAYGDGTSVTLTVNSSGDLDADGSLSTKALYYAGVGYSFKLTDEEPKRGMEDLDTF